MWSDVQCIWPAGEKLLLLSPHMTPEGSPGFQGVSRLALASLWVGGSYVSFYDNKTICWGSGQGYFHWRAVCELSIPVSTKYSLHAGLVCTMYCFPKCQTMFSFKRIATRAFCLAVYTFTCNLIVGEREDLESLPPSTLLLTAIVWLVILSQPGLFPFQAFVALCAWLHLHGNGKTGCWRFKRGQGGWNPTLLWPPGRGWLIYMSS